MAALLVFKHAACFVLNPSDFVTGTRKFVCSLQALFNKFSWSVKDFLI